MYIFECNYTQEHVLKLSYYNAMMLCSKPSVCLSVCPSVCLWRSGTWSQRLEYFENNCTAEHLKLPAQIGSNMGDLIQREHRQH